MSYNYCLLDDQTRLIIGYCNEAFNIRSLARSKQFR